MTALQELAAGQVGPQFVQLLTRTVAAVAINRNFPPPDGGYWTPEGIDEVTREFLADPKVSRRIDWLALSCGTDRALAAALETIVRNFLRDRGRATELGRLVVRVRRALRQCDRFATMGNDRWGVAGGPQTPSATGIDVLAQATAVVPVTFQPWSSTARRREPFADKASIEALIEAVLTTANGTLRPADIARAIAPRLDVVTAPSFASADAGDYPDTRFAVVIGDVADQVADHARASEVLDVLTDRERIALAYIRLSVRELAPLVGLGHSQTAMLKKRVEAVLTEELADEENGQGVAELVLEFAKIWLADRTGQADITFNSA